MSESHASSPAHSLEEDTFSRSSFSDSPRHIRPTLSETPSHELDLNSSQHSFSTALTGHEPVDFSSMDLPSTVEIHPQNGILPGASPSQTYIKRPLNAYMIWTRHERTKMLAKEPKMKMNEVTKAMGERWKNMPDHEKRPYFEMAKRFASDHKKALKDNPNLKYIPVKLKHPKTPAANAAAHASQQTPQAPSHEGSISQSPFSPKIDHSQQGAQPHFNVPTNVYAQNMQQTPMTTIQMSQQAGRPSMQNMAHPPPNMQHQQISQQHQQQQRPPQPRPTPAQALDLYYTSLCQPAFPSFGESQTNPLGMYPSNYYLDQYYQVIMEGKPPQ
uniref:Sex-determining region Y protein n=1 Tax=Acrobeloides nanus TaxID=290746 RepID=A0A914D7Z7_9BILA